MAERDHGKAHKSGLAQSSSATEGVPGKSTRVPKANGAPGGSSSGPSARGPAAPADPVARAERDYRATRPGDWHGLLDHMQANATAPLYLGEMLQLAQGHPHGQALLGYVQQHAPKLASTAQSAATDLERTAGYKSEGAQGDAENLSTSDATLDAAMIRSLFNQHTLAGDVKSSYNGLDRMPESRLGTAMAFAIEAGTLDPRMVAGNRGAGWANPAAPAHVLPGTAPQQQIGVATFVESKLTADLGSSAQGLKSAEGGVGSLDQRLGIELGQIGPALTVGQQGAYADAFHDTKAYTGAVAAENTAVGGLERSLGVEGKALTAFADHAGGTGKSAAASELLGSYQTLAASTCDGAVKALIWAEQESHDRGFGDKSGLQQIVQQAQATIVRTTAIQLHALLGGKKQDPSTVFDRVQAAVQHVQSTVLTPLANVKAIGDMRAVPGLTKKFFELRKLPAAERAKELETLAKEISGMDGPIGKVFTALCDAVGAASAAMNPAQAKAAQALAAEATSFLPEAEKTEQDIREAGKAGEAAAAGKLAKLGERVAGISKLLDGAGLVASAVQTGQDFEAVLKHASVSDVAQLVGDGMQTLGSALQMDPETYPLGLAINLLGSGISALVSIFSGGGPSQEQKDEAQLLGPAGIKAFGPELVQVFTSSHAPKNLATAQQAGMTAAQIKTLATKWGELFSSDDGLSLVAVVRAEMEKQGLKASVDLYTFTHDIAGELAGNFGELKDKLLGGKLGTLVQGPHDPAGGLPESDFKHQP